MSIREEYYRQHAICPNCKSDSYEETTIGFMCSDLPDFKDENHVWCECGWKGTVHDLIPLDTQPKPDTIP